MKDLMQLHQNYTHYYLDTGADKFKFNDPWVNLFNSHRRDTFSQEALNAAPNFATHNIT